MTPQAIDWSPTIKRRRPRVLVADDSAEQRWTLRLALSMLGFEVSEAADGRELFWALEGLSPARRIEPDLVIADVYMPAYNGLDVLSARREWLPRHALIVITAFPDEALVRRVDALGAKLLPKPFSLSDLAKMVREALTTGRA